MIGIIAIESLIHQEIVIHKKFEWKFAYKITDNRNLRESKSSRVYNSPEVTDFESSRRASMNPCDKNTQS